MPVIGLQGIKGGCGTTSITAGLAWSLQKLGQSVLAIDFSPDNMLRLYFNMPFRQSRGWSRAIVEETSWQESAMRYTKLLDFLPFGALSHEEEFKLKSQFEMDKNFWQTQFNLSEFITHTDYNWILIDLPVGTFSPLIQYGLSLADINLCLLNPDVSSHVRLHQQALSNHTYFLINKYNSAFSLQQDLVQLWRQTLPNVVSVIIHADEAIAESLAMKMPPGEYSANSLATKELMTLAQWCLTDVEEQTS